VVLDSLENEAWRSLAKTYKTVYFHINSDLRQYGLTPPQYAVLRTIWRSPGALLPMNEIGKEMVVTFANITTIVDNLEKRSYVRRVRDEHDRRVVRVQLLSQGEILVKRIYTAHQAQIRNLLSSLNERELEALVEYTTRIRDRIIAQE
jgi:DNA-binding MarR family transcriptional regulator